VPPAALVGAGAIFLASIFLVVKLAPGGDGSKKSEDIHPPEGHEPQD
jgi:hypothetical protein